MIKMILMIKLRNNYRINWIMKNDIISGQKEYLSSHCGITLNSKMLTLPLMYWIPKMHKNSTGSRFITASSKFTLKPLSFFIS